MYPDELGLYILIPSFPPLRRKLREKRRTPAAESPDDGALGPGVGPAGQLPAA